MFHNIDFVAAFGHRDGETVQVDVIRGGHRIATARGSAVPLGPPEGGALEVNHGPEGAALPGDCWEGATPDVHAGDLVRVTSGDGVDEVIVDDVSIDAVTRRAGANDVLGDDDDEVWVEGVARSGADGSPIDIAMLDSGEFRDPLDNQLRMEPNEVVAGPVEGTYIAKYRAPFNFVKDPTTTAVALAALERDGHAFGYGHVPLPDDTLRPDGMLVEGIGLANGPAAGCEAAPAAASSAGTTSVDVLNLASTSGLADDATALTVGGWAATALEAADVELRDAAGATVVKPVSGLAAGASAQQGWSAAFTASELAGLAQGVLTARLLVAGAPVGAAKTVVHDTVAPSFAVTPEAGTYTGTQRVTVSGDPVTYVLDGAAPRTYTGAPIVLEPGPHTLALRSEDAAGNVTTRTLDYDIGAPPAETPAATRPAESAPAQRGGGGSPVPPAQTASARPALVASMVRAEQRISARAARRAGLRAVFVAPRGTRGATVRAYRVVGERSRLIGTTTVRLGGGRHAVALRSRAIRRRLGRGLYRLEVVVRGADGRAGAPASSLVRVR